MAKFRPAQLVVDEDGNFRVTTNGGRSFVEIGLTSKWTEDVDADSHSLTNLSTIHVQGPANLSGIKMFGSYFIIAGRDDPLTGDYGYMGVGSILMKHNLSGDVGELWVKTGIADNAWKRVVLET